jgi:phosphatidylglycerophosphate synthase
VTPGAPRVVLVVDPRPGAAAADEITLPDGGDRLDQLVGARAVAEAGQPGGSVRGGPGVADLLLAYDGAVPLCLVDAAALALPTTYGDVVADPRAQTAVLTDDASTRAIAVRVEPAALADRESVEHAARSLRVAPSGLALSVLSGELRARDPAVRVVGSGAFPVHAVWGPADLPAALEREGAVDEARLRLRRASRADDGFLSTFLVRPLSRQLTRRAVARGVRPDAVTAVSCALGLLAAGAYAGGGLGWRILGSLLLLLSLVVDCVDGEVARYTRTFSPLGGWLDVGSDRLKEYAIYAGLAWGADPHAWALASAAFAVLVVRHFVDFGYAESAGAAGARGAGGAGGGGRVSAWSDRTSGRPALLWAKRAVTMPVGERTIILAVLVVAIGIRWSLVVLLVLGGIAGLYTLAGRLGRQRGRLGWLTPAAERAVEQGGLVLLVALLRPGALAAAYLLLAAVALHQYDVVYRRRLTGAVVARSRLDLVPWWARVVVVAGFALALPSRQLRWVLLALGIAWAAAAVADSVSWWRSFVRSGL